MRAALAGGAAVSVTVRMDSQVRAAIAAIADDAWATIEYTDAVFDEATGRWISPAEVAEIEFIAFAAQKKADQIPGGWSPELLARFLLSCLSRGHNPREGRSSPRLDVEMLPLITP